ncbi:MAG TPA: hypothetical protein VGC75_01615, partial [Candidatus Nitrosocosmicus sp.]
MVKIYIAVSACIAFIICGAFLIVPTKTRIELSIYYTDELNKLDQSLVKLRELCLKKTSTDELKKQFFKARFNYKEVAVLTEYFNPYETKFLNGPALNRVEEDNPDVIIPPHGFQLIEEKLFSKWNDSNYSLLNNELLFDEKIISRISARSDNNFTFRDEAVFEALRSSIINLTTLGITGYDSPSAHQSIPEAKATLSGILNILKFYQKDIVEKDKDSYSLFQF